MSEKTQTVRLPMAYPLHCKTACLNVRDMTVLSGQTMKRYYLLAALLLCPAYAEENGTLPTTAPVTETLPVATVTAAPSPLPAPEPVS
jgi:hypothetical protein